jgi:uroporphyrinogen decarboxylase
MMNARERFLCVLNGQIPDRVPIHDTYWETTIERWHGEGLPANVAPEDYFQTEMVRIAGDYTLQFPQRLVKTGDHSRTYWDADGALRQDLKMPEGWTSQWLDFTIKTKEDLLTHRERFRYSESRISDEVLDSYRRARAQGKFVAYSGHACFHPTWMRIGFDNELVLMHEQPEFIHDLFAAQTQLMIDIYEGMRRRGIEFDGAFMADDLGYVKSPLISPRMYRELVFPYHKRLCDHWAKDGLKTILHSDGNVQPLIPHFLEAGFAALHPLEAKAGLDVRQLKQEYGGRLVLFGNIDVRKLAGTREEIEEEISAKLPVAKAGGGYIYHSDHSVPHDVSFENYCFALDRIKHYGRYD